MSSNRFINSINKMYIYIYITILLSLPALSSAKIFNCSQTTDVDSGHLSISRSQPTCGFTVGNDTNSFSIQTDNLELYDGEYIEVKEEKSSYNISQPIDPGFLFFTEKLVEIIFHLNKLSNDAMVVGFFKNKNSITAKGDIQKEFTVKTFGSDNFNLDLTTKGLAYVEILGSTDVFSHHLVESSNATIPIRAAGKQPIIVRTSPVNSDCSKNYVDKSETTHDLNGPDAKSIQSKYKCINVFTTDQGHYDVDFKNFLDLVDDDDQLLIDDGFQPLLINRRMAKIYDLQKPVVSFKGLRLAVVYNSPRVSNPRGVFKLTVTSRSFGGVIDADQALVLPQKGLALYSLRPQEFDQAAILEFSGKLSGANVKITNNRRQVISLSDGQFLPPVIAFNQPETRVEFDVKSKISTKISYKQRKECSGTIFGSTGTVAIDGGSKTCYWLLGQKSTLKINYIDLIPNGCLEIHPLNSEKALFSRCNISSLDVLPQFILEPSYLKITLPNNKSRIDASISQPLVTQVNSASAQQTKISSLGYPSLYPWTANSDNYPLDAKDKSVILSIVDLDIRAGEKLVVNNLEVDKFAGDIDLSNQASNITLRRTPNAKEDFGVHRGYSLVLTQYQSIITAPSDKTDIQTPANLTSLLLKIAAPQNKRLSYSISNSTTNKDYSMKIFDAKSIFGLGTNETSGSTTSNTLLVSLVTTKTNTLLPQLKITYNVLDCNTTVDHVCDSSTRCVPVDKLCKGKSYCQDGSDLRLACASGPTPPPQIIERGASGFTVFFLSLLMFSLGIVATLYGPDMYKNLEGRFRSGQYTTFTSTE